LDRCAGRSFTMDGVVEDAEVPNPLNDEEKEGPAPDAAVIVEDVLE